MRLVEAVSGELLDDVEGVLGLFPADPPLLAPGDELRPLLLHHVRLLLSHGPPQNVGLAEAEAREDGGALHDLLLIEHHPVGLPQHVLEKRVQVLHLRLAVLAADVLIDHAAPERARAVHGEHGHEIVEAVGADFLQQTAHAPRFQLKDPEGIGPLQHLVGLSVVQGDVLDVGDRLTAQGDVLEGLFDDGEGSEPEKVHLHQPQLLDGLHGVLGDDLVVPDSPYRDEVRHGHGRDDHTRRVLRAVPGKALDVGGDGEHLLHHGPFSVHRRQLG